MPRPDIKNHVGARFGYLTVLRREGSTAKYAAWRCACDCGEEVVVDGYSLRKGTKKACCINGHRWKPDYAKLRPPGLTRLHPSEYSSFSKMRERCLNPNCQSYPRYGGRGVIVCERWSSFANFFADMGKKPTPEHSLDRYPDPHGNYEPTNCRWATDEQQRRNMRTSVYVNYDGKQVLLLDLVGKLGLKRGQVYQRLKIGWSLEDALTVSIRSKKGGKHKKKNRQKP